jgi:hypothetical protein
MKISIFWFISLLACGLNCYIACMESLSAQDSIAKMKVGFLLNDEQPAHENENNSTVELFECGRCKKLFFLNYQLVRHENRAHRGESLPSKKVSISSAEILLQRKPNALEDLGQRHWCPFTGCPKSYVYLKRLQWHIARDHSAT